MNQLQGPSVWEPAGREKGKTAEAVRRQAGSYRGDKS